MNYLWFIDVPYACFGILSNEHGTVEEAAPIASWTKGKPLLEVLRYYRNKGATRIERSRPSDEFWVVSGGQTGADMGAALGAISCAVPYEGWLPKGRRCEAGVVPHSFSGFREYSASDYLERTELNVLEADATLIFTMGGLTPGSRRTKEIAGSYGRPCLWLDLLRGDGHVKTITDFLKAHTIKSLNFAGSRESKAPGIQKAVEHLTIQVLARS